MVDVPGSSSFVVTSCVPDVVKECNFMVAVYDPTQDDSFATVEEWIQMMRKAVGNENLPGVLVATKSDLEDRMVVSPQQGEELASEYGLGYCSVSALKNVGVQLPFVSIARQLNTAYLDSVDRFNLGFN